MLIRMVCSSRYRPFTLPMPSSVDSSSWCAFTFFWERTMEHSFGTQFGMFSLLLRERVRSVVTVSIPSHYNLSLQIAVHWRSYLGFSLWYYHGYVSGDPPCSFSSSKLSTKGPYCAGIFDPRAWSAAHSEQVTDTVTLEFTRVVLAIGVFAIGVELPKAYMAKHWRSLFFLLVPVMTWVCSFSFLWRNC